MHTMERPTIDTLDYCFIKRLNRHKYPIDTTYFMNIILNCLDLFRVIKVKDDIVGIVGVIPMRGYLVGYLVLTDNYPKYARYFIKEMRKVLKTFTCPVKFINHNDDIDIHRWYGLIGFKRIGDFWIKE